MKPAFEVSPGAWHTYTPALVNLTLGSGTLSAAWSADDKTTHVRIRVAFGAGTSVGGAVTIGLPRQAEGGDPQLLVCFIGGSGGTVPIAGVGYVNAGASVVQPWHPTSSGSTTQVHLGTVGLALGSGSYVMLQGTYEAA